LHGSAGVARGERPERQAVRTERRDFTRRPAKGGARSARSSPAWVSIQAHQSECHIAQEGADKSVPLECLDMSGTAGEEHANLYTRGVNEAASGAELAAQEVLDVLEVFGEDGVRMYLVGFLEGVEDRTEEEIEEYEFLEASIAFVVHESSVSILQESEDTLQVWVERAPKDLSAGVDLHIVNDEDEILQGGRIVAVKFEDVAETSETASAIATVENWKYEIVEYSDPEDWPRD
jgi:hypothetical protein